MHSPIRLYLDEDSMRASLLRALRSRQVDVSTVAEADLMGHPDEEQLSFATAQARTIFTFNRGDFARLHKAWITAGKPHAGIIVSDQLETGVVVRRLLKLLAARSAEEIRDQFEYLSSWR